jgi:hypothetical protein
MSLRRADRRRSARSAPKAQLFPGLRPLGVAERPGQWAAAREFGHQACGRPPESAACPDLRRRRTHGTLASPSRAHLNRRGHQPLTCDAVCSAAVLPPLAASWFARVPPFVSGRQARPRASPGSFPEARHRGDRDHHHGRGLVDAGIARKTRRHSQPNHHHGHAVPATCARGRAGSTALVVTAIRPACGRPAI